ncbi:MAG: helix-hairpin-helix domain-containing protein [Enhygromyxa sp.]
MLLAPVLAALSLHGLVGAPASLGRARSCERAQLIDGELRCDEELLEELRAVCVAGPARALEPGDAVHACVVGRMPAKQLAALEQPVDLNSASIDELASLPGIGPVIAERIVAGRPYASVDELLRVKGIGPARLKALRPRARVAKRLRAIPSRFPPSHEASQ